MSIDKIIAKIPCLPAEQLENLRTNAQARLSRGDVNARRVIVALDARGAAAGIPTHIVRAELAAQLDAATPAMRIELAFLLEPLTASERAMIQTFLEQPGLSSAELSCLHGWPDNAWEAQFEKLCIKRAAWIVPDQDALDDHDCLALPLITVTQQDQEGALRYWLRPEAVQAFMALGVRAQHPAKAALAMSA